MHAAYNLTTGVVMIVEGSGNQFKRYVAMEGRWDITHGLGKSRWVFAHGKDAEDKVYAKAVAILKRG